MQHLISASGDFLFIEFTIVLTLGNSLKNKNLLLIANENKKIDKYKKMVTILVSPDAQSLIEKYLNDNKE